MTEGDAVAPRERKCNIKAIVILFRPSPKDKSYLLRKLYTREKGILRSFWDFEMF